MTHQPPLPEVLRDAIALDAYLDAVSNAVAPLGFLPEDTLAAVSICRDELTQHMMPEVERRWGPPFGLGGLGGLPSLGRTGWGACLSHVPHQHGRGKLLVFGLPHLGVGPNGELGQSLRRYQDSPTPTCGALESILASWNDDPGPECDDEGLADHEAQLLRCLLADELADPPTDIMDLTRAAAGAVEHEMTIQLEALAPWHRMDVALMTGIQIHLPGRVDHVLPITAQYRCDAGQAKPLEIAGIAR